MDTLREGDGCAIIIDPLAPPLAGEVGADAGPLPPASSGRARVRAIRAETVAAASPVGSEVEGGTAAGTWRRILWSGT